MSKPLNINGKNWTAADVRMLILTDDAALIRALLLINSRQTTDEKKVKQTIYKNHRGFRSSDAPFTKFVEYYEKFGSLTVDQMNILRKRMPRYAGQIFKVMRERARQQAEAQTSPA